MKRNGATPECRSIVRALKNRRIGLELSQWAVAEMMGSPRQCIGSWERGEKSPTLRSLVEWAGVLDMKLGVEAK